MTHSNTFIYDDLYHDKTIKEHIKLNETTVCPLSRVQRGGGFAFFTRLLVGVAELRGIKHHNFFANGLNSLLQYKGMPRPPQFDHEESKRNLVEANKRVGAKKVGLTQLLTKEKLAELRPRRKFVLDLKQCLPLFFSWRGEVEID